MMNHQPTPGVLTSPVARHVISPASCLSFAVGAWLVLSPVTLGYAGSDPWWNPMGVGALIALMALARVAGAVGPALWRVIIGLAGAWLVGSAAWPAVGGVAAWNLAVCGGAILLLASATGSAARRLPARRSLR